MSTRCPFCCWEYRIKLRFSHVSLEAIDAMQSRLGVDRYTIWAIADDITVDLMEFVEVQMTGSFDGVVDRVPVGDPADERSRILS